jgi:signal transduction histidine kinase
VDLDTIAPRPDWCAALAAGGIRQLVVLAQAGERVGLLELGEKANLKPYSREDLEFVDQLCASGAVGLSNALLFDRSDAQRRELVELSATLEQRVVERTDALRRANERLRDLDRLKSRFFANISHELRTPLSLVLAPLESMLDGELGELDGGQRERLAGIQRNALRLLERIDALLELSKQVELHGAWPAAAVRAGQPRGGHERQPAGRRQLAQHRPPPRPGAASLLLVDDEPEMLELLEQLLGQRWELWSCRDGGRALALLRAQRHDLVLADVMMPGMSGLELCQRIKSDPRLQNTPVVLLTARSGEQARIDGHCVGADQYLSKPFRPAELRAAIEGLLAGRSRQSEAAAQRRAASLETLLAGLAHELRNACHQARNARTAAGEMLRRELDAEHDAALLERLERMQAIAQRALERIAAVVQSLQQYAFQRPQPAWTELEVDELVERAVGQLTAVEAKGVALELSLESAGRVRGPREALRQLVLNLVENAVQAVEPGGVVQVSTRAETGRVVLEVADDGCGMEAEQRERIFDLFYTTKEPGRGIGLGLAMVDKTVAELGGEVAVDSRPGRGSRFTVELPAPAPRRPRAARPAAIGATEVFTRGSPARSRPAPAGRG